MDYISEIKNYYQVLIDTIGKLNLEEINDAMNAIDKVYQNEATIYICGNGGSAAMASHLSVDLTKAAGVRAINFNEADLLTCFANDFGYEHWVSKALDYYSDSGDLVILISSSGKSPNMINGAKTAKEKGLDVVTFSGFDAQNPLRNLGILNFWANSTSYNFVEMAHHVWLLAVVDRLIK